MKILSVRIENFKSYKDETEIKFDDFFSAIIGKSDVGKSTILEALDIFFNDKYAKTKYGKSAHYNANS